MLQRSLLEISIGGLKHLPLSLSVDNKHFANKLTSIKAQYLKRKHREMNVVNCQNCAPDAAIGLKIFHKPTASIDWLFYFQKPGFRLASRSFELKYCLAPYQRNRSLFVL